MIKEFNLKSANGYKMMVEIYNSTNQVVEDLKKREMTSTAFQDMENWRYSNWYGVKNYKEALDLLESGYQPIVDKMKENIKSNLQGQGKRISFHNDIVGYAPIVPLAILGVPNSMLNSKMKPIKAKVIDLYYDGAFSCMVDSKDIIKTGCEMLAMVLQLEQQGYRFNIYKTDSYSDSRSCDMLCVKIKDAMQPVDLKRISFAMAHTAFFRVIGFDWYSKCPKAKHRTDYGHAMCHEKRVNNKLQEITKEMFGSNAVYVSGNKLLKTQDKEKYLRELFVK